jgi:hypothetical protein
MVIHANQSLLHFYQMLLSADTDRNTASRVNQSPSSSNAQGRIWPVTTDTILALNAAATTIEADGISFM